MKTLVCHPIWLDHRNTDEVSCCVGFWTGWADIQPWKISPLSVLPVCVLRGHVDKQSGIMDVSQHNYECVILCSWMGAKQVSWHGACEEGQIIWWAGKSTWGGDPHKMEENSFKPFCSLATEGGWMRCGQVDEEMRFYMKERGLWRQECCLTSEIFDAF